MYDSPGRGSPSVLNWLVAVRERHACYVLWRLLPQELGFAECYFTAQTAGPPDHFYKQAIK
jgi:hypothetical protein